MAIKSDFQNCISPRKGLSMDELTELIKKLKEKYPEMYRHIIGLIKTLLK